ncbi:hypothetical protein HW115_04265 [Verrucomicrobiaceae bacterium N1E253]|uniref:AsmA-like C-terminal domain-containing protein n=1 Tax=Oceaniferula marina TaxID=2748318 RepID=A0A851GCA5_9BACT|nr:hypothetical protein [Oceaniferula marina]NWK54809.1 hypothetical protein [Oceaniferula marina]
MRGKTSRQRRRKQVLIKLFGLIACVFLVVVLLVGWLVNRMISESFLESQIESSLTCKASIGKLELSLLRSPARITLHDLALSGLPDDRKAKDARVEVDQVDLDVSLWSLMRKHVDISRMTVRGANVVGTVYEEGGASLEALFESPDKEERPGTSGKARRRKEDSPEKSGGFNVFDHDDFVASLGGFFMHDCRFDLTLEQSGLRVRGSSLNVSLGRLTIDPKRLQDTDTAELEMSVNVRLDSVKGWHYGNLDISGKAKARLFNPQSGDLEPDVLGHFDLADSSWLNTRIPVISEAWEEMNRLKKIGIEIDPLPEKAVFGRSEAVAAHYHRGKITVLQDLSLWVSDWEVAMIDGSWVHTETNQHVIEAELLASKPASAKLYGLIASGLDYLPEDIRAMVGKDMKKQLFRGDRFLVRVKSKETLSDPKIRLVDGIPDFAKSAEEAGKKLIKEKAGGLLKGLLGD